MCAIFIKESSLSERKSISISSLSSVSELDRLIVLTCGSLESVCLMFSYFKGELVVLLSSILLSSLDMCSVSGVPFVWEGVVHVVVPRSVRES